MQKLSSRIALLAFAGMLTAVPPAFAAPSTGGSNTNKNTEALDCTLLVNIHNPLCLQQQANHMGPKGNTNPPTNTGSGGSNNNNNNNKGSAPHYTGPKPGTFNFNQNDRSQFHQRFHGFNFGNFSFFFTPNFSITIGTSIPHSYYTHLRPVPSNVYRYYPWFKGYLYFVDRSGDFVIVSPRNHHIVAVL